MLQYEIENTRFFLYKDVCLFGYFLKRDIFEKKKEFNIIKALRFQKSIFLIGFRLTLNKSSSIKSLSYIYIII